MQEELEIIDINDAAGNVAQHSWLVAAERVHRQLRPLLPPDYSGTMGRVFGGGGRMSVAVRNGGVAGLAVYLMYENTVHGMHMYVDDLGTDADQRSEGVGKKLLHHLEQIARSNRCVRLTLDSGTQRQQAHKFYFRAGLVVSAFHFDKPLVSA